MVRTLVLITAVTVSLPAIRPPLHAASRDTQVSYEELMSMPPGQRKQTLAASSPENRAAVMKQHLERWLDVHRPDLSRNAQALVREAIALVTPDLYATPPLPAIHEQQLRLSQRMACALGDRRAATLMQLDSPPQRIAESWADRTREWLDWLVNCAGR